MLLVFIYLFIYSVFILIYYLFIYSITIIILKIFHQHTFGKKNKMIFIFCSGFIIIFCCYTAHACQHHNSHTFFFLMLPPKIYYILFPPPEHITKIKKCSLIFPGKFPYLFTVNYIHNCTLCPQNSLLHILLTLFLYPTLSLSPLPSTIGSLLKKK